MSGLSVTGDEFPELRVIHRFAKIFVEIGMITYMDRSDSEQLRLTLSNRYSVLETIAETGKTKPELVEELAHSRSTIDRAIKELDDASCVIENNREFRASPLGRTALQAYMNFRKTSEGIYSAEPVVNSLDVDDPIDHVIFKSAKVYVSDPQTPEIGVKKSIELFENTQRFRGYTPVVFEEFIDVHLKQHERDRFESEIILERKLPDKLLSYFPEKFQALREHNDQVIYTTDKLITYAPWIMVHPETTYAGMTVFDDGAIKGVVINESQDAISWVKQLLDMLTPSEPVSV